MKKYILTALLASSLLPATAAFADNNSTSTQDYASWSQVYIGAASGYSQNSQTNQYYDDEVAASWFLFGENMHGRLFAGYNINNRFGVEVGYARTVNLDGEAELTDGTTTWTSKWHYKVSGPDFNLLAKQALSDKFTAFAKAGFAIMTADVHDEYIFDPSSTFETKQTKVVPLAGAGLNFHVTNRFDVGFSGTYQGTNDFVPANTFYALQLSYILGEPA